MGQPKLLLVAPEHAERLRTDINAKLVFNTGRRGINTFCGIPIKVWDKRTTALLLSNNVVEHLI